MVTLSVNAQSGGQGSFGPALVRFSENETRTWCWVRQTGRSSRTGSIQQHGPMTDEEYLWEPVPDRWSMRRRMDEPGPRATLLAGTGDWGPDAASYPPPGRRPSPHRVASEPPQ